MGYASRLLRATKPATVASSSEAITTTIVVVICCRRRGTGCCTRSGLGARSALVRVSTVIVSTVVIISAIVIVPTVVVISAIVVVSTVVVIPTIVIVSTVVVISTIVATNNSRSVHTVIQGSVLSDGHHYWSVVRGSVHGAEAVHAWWETIGDIDGQYTVDGRGIDSLEELEDGWVQYIGRINRVELLDGQMRVSNDIVALQLLGSAIVVCLRIDKVASDHILDVDRRSKLLVGLECATILGERNLCSGHIARRDDISNWHTIAASLNELLAIRQRLAFAKVDEVVVRGQRWTLLIDRRVLAVIRASRAEDRGVQY